MSQKHFADARDMFAAVGARIGQAWATWGIGETIRLSGSGPGARGMYQQNNAWERVTQEMSPVDDQFIRSIAQYEEAIRLFQVGNRGSVDRGGEACCVSAQGEAFRVRGDTSSAGDLLITASKLFQDDEDKYGVAWCLEGLGDIAQAEGDSKRARDCWERARGLSPTSVDPSLIQRIATKLGASISVAQGT